MPTEKQFVLAPIKPKYGALSKQIMGIKFDVESENIFEPRNPVLESLSRPKLDYGHLFTYCFRRFGYPNGASDSYKEIAQWNLTTPHKDMVLIVRPSVLPEPHFNIFFAVPQELFWACTNWERADLDAWWKRKLDWAEKQGLPDWIPEVLESYQAASKHFSEATWRDIYLMHIVFHEPRKDDKPSPSIRERSAGQMKIDAMFTEFASKVAGYKEIEASPGFRKRPATLEDWAENDPLKPLAKAAIVALSDLSTPVRVRDSAINAFGVSEYEEGTVDEPASAGRAFGSMLNAAPVQTGELGRFAFDLGKGNFGDGLKKVLRLAKQAQRVKK
jgi:hypothetical protein